MSSEVLNALVTLIVGVVGAALTYAGVKATSRANREANEPANWQSLTTEMKAFFREQLAERDERLGKIEDELSWHRRYAAWLVTLGFDKPPFLTFDEFVAEYRTR